MQRIEASSNSRFRPLDIIRGLAIIGMVFSAMLPQTLPAWMFHARTPPPSGKFDPSIMGITWVDLVLPFFLFSLGAAIPFALSRRVKNSGSLKTIQSIVTRFLLLAFFAVFLPQINSQSWGSTGHVLAQLLTISGFVMMFCFFVRIPQNNILTKWQTLINVVGFVGIVLLLASKGLCGANAFNWSKQNIILMILANTFLFTGLTWLFTKDNLPMRLLVMVGLIALRFSSEHTGWVADGLKEFNAITHLTFLGELINVSLMQFSHIAILGTIAGEFILCYLTDDIPSVGNVKKAWTSWQYALVALLSLVYIVLTCYALFINKDMELFAGVLASAIILMPLVAKPQKPIDVLIRRIAITGWMLILIGLLFGPANDGIHKDSPSTIGYLYCSAGLAYFAILGFTILCDVFKVERCFSLLQANGQNPMIAYVIGGHLLWPILEMIPVGQNTLNGVITIGFKGLLGTTVGLLSLAILKTLAIMLCVAYFTRHRYFWRT